MKPNNQNTTSSNAKTNSGNGLIIGGLVLFIFGGPVLGFVARTIANVILQNPTAGTSGSATVNGITLIALALSIVGGPVLVFIGLRERRKNKR